jgi:DNA-binding IclR family transcriptional regulator
LPRGERQVLTAIAQHPGGVTREQLTVLTGYKRSSRDTYVQRLRERGHVDAAGEQLVATQAGVDALGANFEPLPTGDALREHWLQRLPEGERRVLEVLIVNYPAPVERDAISDATDYKRSSRDTYLQRLGARRLVVTERGQVRASEELFG